MSGKRKRKRDGVRVRRRRKWGEGRGKRHEGSKEVDEELDGGDVRIESMAEEEEEKKKRRRSGIQRELVHRK